MEITFVKPEGEYLPAFRNMMLEYYKDGEDADTPEEEILGFIDRLIGDTDIRTAIAIADSCMAGFVMWWKDVEGHDFSQIPAYGTIVEIGVRPEWRRMGIGRALVDHAEWDLLEMGAQGLYISAYGPAVKFWRDRGYTESLGIANNGLELLKKAYAWSSKIGDIGTMTNYMYVVVFARHEGKWLYSRHTGRDTWETAGGHIEAGETPLDAAKRELWEETGATDFDIRAVCDYEAHDVISHASGRVFLADVRKLGELPKFEMCEICHSDTYPEKITYPAILPILYDFVKDMI